MQNILSLISFFQKIKTFETHVERLLDPSVVRYVLPLSVLPVQEDADLLNNVLAVLV